MGSTNGEILGWDGMKHDDDRVSTVRGFVKLRWDAILRGEEISDPIKVFIKQEPHKLKKLEEGTFRLISAVSLIDTFVDRILFSWVARKQLNTVGHTPCLVGWSPVRGGWRLLQDVFGNKATLCLDKSAWDWTVQGFLVDMWLQFFREIAINAPQWWLDAIKVRFDILFDRSVFKFEDGTIVYQPVRGIMKSGCYLTIILNSLSQSLLHYLCNIRCGYDPMLNQPKTIGDDTVQENFDFLEQYAQEMKKLGAVIKELKVQHWVEFAGFCFTGKTCFPAYWQKHLFNIQHAPNLEETLISYQYLYINEPVMYEFFSRLAREIGPHCVLSRIEANDIMNIPS